MTLVYGRDSIHFLNESNPQMPLAFEFINHSFVLLSEGVTPSHLSTDERFLQRLVKREWNWQLAQPTIVTPVISQIPFTNGVVMLVTPGRFHVTDGGDPNPGTSKAKEVIVNFIKLNGSIQWAAIGINFSAVVPYPDPQALITRTCLNDSFGNVLQGEALQSLVFAKDVNNARRTITIHAGEQFTGGTPQAPVSRPVVIVDANYHFDISGGNDNTVRLQVRKAPQLHSDLSELLSTISAKLDEHA